MLLFAGEGGARGWGEHVEAPGLGMGANNSVQVTGGTKQNRARQFIHAL